MCAYSNHLDMALLELSLDLVKIRCVKDVARGVVLNGKRLGTFLERRALGMVVFGLCDILINRVVVLPHGAEDGRWS